MEYRICMFCGSLCTPKKLIGREEIREWIKNHGDYHKLAGKIGGRYICTDCLLELKFLLGFHNE